MPAPLPKLTVPFGPLLTRLELETDVGASVAHAQNADEALVILQAGGHRAEAARLLAHALPKREAVWWACMCARAVPDPALPPPDLNALAAAEAWVRSFEADATRRATWEAAQKTEFRTPEAWAAVGAFWSGGSMAPQGQPVVPPGDHLTGVAVSGAIVLASVRIRPERAEARLDRFIASACDIAVGGAGRIPVEET